MLLLEIKNNISFYNILRKGSSGKFMASHYCRLAANVQPSESKCRAVVNGGGSGVRQAQVFILALRSVAV